MRGIKYWVKIDCDNYKCFDDKIIAFRYAHSIGATGIYMCVLNSMYSWNWAKRKWEVKR